MYFAACSFSVHASYCVVVSIRLIDYAICKCLCSAGTCSMAAEPNVSITADQCAALGAVICVLDVLVS